jgi:hypothetical protein
MGESFTAYETTTFPLAFPIDRSPNKSLQRALPRCSSMSTHVFSRIELTVGVTSKKASSYQVPLENVEAMND